MLFVMQQSAANCRSGGSLLPTLCLVLLETFLDSFIGGFSIELYCARLADAKFLGSTPGISKDFRWLKRSFGLGPVVVPFS